MNILYLTKSKQYTLLFLEKMIDDGHNLTVVCKDYDSFLNSEMWLFCRTHSIPFFDNEDLYRALKKGELEKYDFAISNTFGKLIKKELIDWLDGNIINLHGAILPEYKGMFTYNWGLFNGESVWGVTAHFVDESFDTGSIITIKEFQIDPKSMTVAELERKTQETAFYLSVEIIEMVIKGIPLNRKPQTSEGHYYSRRDFENLKRIEFSDSINEIERKIHSCWCPPFEGAYLSINDKKYYLLSAEMLEDIKNG